MLLTLLTLGPATPPSTLTIAADQMLSVPLDDPKVDLSAFVIATPKGDVVLDELLSMAAELDPGVLYAQSGRLAKMATVGGLTITGTGPKPVCVEVLGLRVCSS